MDVCHFICVEIGNGFWQALLASGAIALFALGMYKVFEMFGVWD